MRRRKELNILYILNNMKYSGIIYNDITAAPGLCVTFFTQGCPHHCLGCQNPETWSFEDGKEFTPEILDSIIEGLTAQGIKRTFCLMGGEPLCDENLFLSYLLIATIKERLPETPIYIWSGYTFEELIEKNNNKINQILSMSDVLVDGKYIQEQRDITLTMRGSKNQKIIDLKDIF